MRNPKEHLKERSSTGNRDQQGNSHTRRVEDGGAMRAKDMDQVPNIMGESGDRGYEWELGGELIEKLMNEGPQARRPRGRSPTVGRYSVK